MATTYNQYRKNTGVKSGTQQTKTRDYDRDILSAEDYAAVQQARENWHNATDDAGRQQANQAAEEIRGRYGYSMGADGATYTALNPRPGTSSNTNLQLQLSQGQAQNQQFDSTWDDQVNALADQILNRPQFQYDLNADAMYDQYANQYRLLGQQAMQDTMGQAAGLTGGYGSSYAQTAGQQAYQGYLDRLNEVVPELYAQARTAYDQQGQDLYSQLGLAQNMYDTEYGQYQDAVQNAQQNLSYWQSVAEQENADYWQQWQQDQYEAEQAYGHQQDAYNNLVNLISNTGYSPTTEELAAAGMTPGEAAAWQSQWQQNQATGGSTGGSRGGNPGPGSDTGNELAGIASEIYGLYPGATIDSRTISNALNAYGLSTQDRLTVQQMLAQLGMAAGGRM